MDGWWHGSGVHGIADSQGGFKGPVSDSCFDLFGDEVEDGGAGRFGAGASCCGDCDEWKQGFGYGEAEAEWGVDKVEEITVGEARVEIHELCRVND